MHFDLQDIEKYNKSQDFIDIFVEINQILDWKIKVQKEIVAVK